MKDSHKIFFIAVLPVLIYHGVVYLGVPWIQRNELKLTGQAMLKMKHTCVNGSLEIIERAGKLGYQRYCVRDGKKYGRWEKWEAQKLEMEGNYLDGKEHGQWIVWNKDGTKFRVIEYNHGIEVKNELIKPIR